jgi:hypothetical protein
VLDLIDDISGFLLHVGTDSVFVWLIKDPTVAAQTVLATAVEELCLETKSLTTRTCGFGC